MHSGIKVFLDVRSNYFASITQWVVIWAIASKKSGFCIVAPINIELVPIGEA
jgi:hypothetical protein